MKITGSATMAAPINAVWAALTDPAVLAEVIPGCERCERAGAGAVRLTVTIAMSAVRGSYDAEVRVLDRQAPSFLVLAAAGTGDAGSIAAEVIVHLSSDDEGSTAVSYDADIKPGGAIAGIGQRTLAGVARRMADQFLAALGERVSQAQPQAQALAPAEAPRPEPTQSPAPLVGPAAARAVERAPDGVGRITGSGLSTEVKAGAAVGGAIGLAGIVIGAVLGRRRRRSSQARP